MNTKKYILTSLLAVLFLGFTSCEGDTEPIDPLLNVPGEPVGNNGGGGNNPPNQSYTFKAQIDGQQFIANQAVAGFNNAGGAAFSLISVSGVKTSNLESISLSILGSQAGTYPLEFAGATINYNTSISAGIAGSFSSSALDNPIIGSINITTFDLANNKISGTFQGTVYNFDEDEIKIISNGEFTNVPLTTAP